jgi:hypothetical protein
MPDLKNLPNVTMYIHVFPIRNGDNPDELLFQVHICAKTWENYRVASADYYGSKEDVKYYLMANFPDEVIDHDDTVGKIFSN